MDSVSIQRLAGNRTQIASHAKRAVALSFPAPGVIMLPQFGLMLGELEISNITAAVLVVVAPVFLGSFAVVSLQTGELIKPPKR